MGFGKGSEIANDIWEKIRSLVPYSNRKETACAIIDALEKHDWDTQQECEKLFVDAGRVDALLCEESDYQYEEMTRDEHRQEIVERVGYREEEEVCWIAHIERIEDDGKTLILHTDRSDQPTAREEWTVPLATLVCQGREISIRMTERIAEFNFRCPTPLSPEELDEIEEAEAEWLADLDSKMGIDTERADSQSDGLPTNPSSP